MPAAISAVTTSHKDRGDVGTSRFIAHSNVDGSYTDGAYSYTGEAHYLWTETYTISDPVTKADLIAFARARMDDAAWQPAGSDVRAVFKVTWARWPGSASDPIDSGSDPLDCTGTDCRGGSVEASAFQYKIKLNKCCGYTKIRSSWLEIFVPQTVLDWFASLEGLSDSDVIPARPEGIIVTPKVWEWEGTPALCNDSDGSGGSGSDDNGPYSDESMHSPWSATVAVAEGEEGIVILTRYRQLCYGPIPDDMPDVFGANFIYSDGPEA